MEDNKVVAPFVMKIYDMVNNPSTDLFITWGATNNCFIVHNPSEFCQKILPAYFKHQNFSSFVRQLNTYGFRKVDPDRWVFANEWFLRGQTHLLCKIMRKKNICSNSRNEEDEDKEILMEIRRLKQEQKLLDEQVLNMKKRIEATEKRPQQMMAFLSKVVNDPGILSRMMLETTRYGRLNLENDDKKRRLMLSSSASTPAISSWTGGSVSSLVNSESEEDPFHVDAFCQSSPEMTSSEWLRHGQFMGDLNMYGSSSLSPGSSAGSKEIETAVAVAGNGVFYDKEDIVNLSYAAGGIAVGEAARPSSYPFSLFEGGF